MDNDHWTLEVDRLGMGGAGDRLARLILQCQPPYAICVQGKWGSGKTSLLRYAMASLGGEPLAMTLKTSSEPRNELPSALQAAWDQRAGGAEALIAEVLLKGLTAAQRKKNPGLRTGRLSWHDETPWRP